MENRYDRLHYMNTGTTDVPVWSLMNEGISTFDDDLAPKTETKQYIADRNERDILTGYKPTYKYTAELDHADPVSQALYIIGADQKVGEQVEIVTVDVWTLSSGVCDARKGTYNVIPSKAGSGDPGAALMMEGTLSQDGDLTMGEWTVLTNTFTPTGAVVYTAQAVSETVATGAATPGTLVVTVTAAGMLTGSPDAINVAVLAEDTAAQVAAKIRAAFVLDAALYAFFTVDGIGAVVTITARTGVAVDATMGIALTTADSTGVTFA